MIFSEVESQANWWDFINTWSVSHSGSFVCIWATANQVIVCIVNHVTELWPQDSRFILTIVCSMISAWSRVSTWSRTLMAIPLKRWRATPRVCPITVIFVEITIKHVWKKVKISVSWKVTDKLKHRLDWRMTSKQEGNTKLKPAKMVISKSND